MGYRRKEARECVPGPHDSLRAAFYLSIEGGGEGKVAFLAPGRSAPMGGKGKRVNGARDPMIRLAAGAGFAWGEKRRKLEGGGHREREEVDFSWGTTRDRGTGSRSKP